MDLQLQGCRAVVTGGSKGLGRAIAAELLAEGASVAICGRHPDTLDSAATELRTFGGPVHAFRTDVTDPDQVTDFLDKAAIHLGGIDILVNNAGAARPGRFLELSDADWKTDIEVKLFSQLRCTRAALPHLQRSASPRVINVNAVYGHSPNPDFLTTSVNRAACLALTRALAVEFAVYEILVNSVNIGFVATPQWDSIIERLGATTDSNLLDDMAKRHVPLRRFGAPDEVAGAVAFLASPRASYITGAWLDIGGGLGISS